MSGSDLPTDRVVDHVRIDRLQSAYADVVNRRAWSELATLFDPDTPIRLDTATRDPIELIGPDEFARFVSAAVERFAFFEFVILNRRIELHDDPDSAAARIFMCEIRRDAGTLDWSTAYGVYHDRYRRDAEGWRFARARLPLHHTDRRRGVRIRPARPRAGSRPGGDVMLRRAARSVATLLAVGFVAAGCGGGADPAPPVAAAEPPKLTVTGDSISVGLGAALRDAADPSTEVKVIGVGGTGLARPDVFDWPARLDELARDFPPEVVVFSVGSNDAQDIVDASGAVVAGLGDDGAWESTYRALLAASFDAFEGTDTQVVWVGHVRTAEDRVGLANRRIHELAVEVASTRDRVTVEDLGELLDSGDAVATDCLVPDGVHLSTGCLDRAAEQLAERIDPGRQDAG